MSPWWVRESRLLLRPKFSPSQEIGLLLIVEFRAPRTVDPVRCARYSAGTAHVQGSRLLSNVKFREAIAKAQAKTAAKAEVTVERIVNELAKIGFANMQDYMGSTPGGDPYLDFSKLTLDQAAALAEVTVEEFVDGRGEDSRADKRVKFKLHDKRAALPGPGPSSRHVSGWEPGRRRRFSYNFEFGRRRGRS